MVINNKIKRTMLENKSQYIGSIVLIILNCLLFTMFNQLSINMTGMTASFEKNYVQEDANFVTGAPLDNIQELEDRFNVRIEEGSAFDYVLSEDKTLRIFRENTKVNIPAVIEGKGLGKNEILLDPAFAQANQLKIGDEIALQEQSFKIAGYMSLPNYIYPLKTENDIINDSNSFGIAVIGKEDFAKFGRGNSFYSIKFNADNTSADIEGSQFRDYLQSNHVIISQWTDIEDSKRVTLVTTKIEGINKMSTIMPLAILLLTCILAGIVIRRLLNRESDIIGTFYALGYKKREIYRHYMRYPVVIALIGSVIGTILGALLVKPMLDFMLTYFNMPFEGIQFDVLTVAASLLIPLIFLSISGYLVLRKELRYSPVDLMRGTKQKSKVNFIERKLKLEKLKFPAKFKIREQLRSLSRLAFLFIGVMLATMMLLLGFTAKSSLDHYLNESVRNSFNFEYEYMYNSLHDEALPPDAESFSASTVVLKTDSKTDFIISGINPDTQFVILKDQTGTKLNTSQVIITKPLASKLQVSVGDTIEVVNKLDAKVYSVTVETIAESYIGNYIFMPIEEYNTLFNYPAGSYMGLWSENKLPITEDQLYSVKSVEDSIKAFGTLTKPLEDAIGIISFMSFIIGLIVILVVTSLIIEENRGNISLMKIFGYRKKEINSLILNSSTLIVVAGYIVGIPMILASMSELYGSLTRNIDLTIPVTINYVYLIVGFIVVFFMYELSKALSRKKINKISMSEALKAGRE